MKKYLLLQLICMAFLMISYEAVSYGSGKFSDLYNQAIEYYKQGKYDQAGKKFEEALELKPNDTYALYGLGNTYYCKAKYDEAIKVYTKAINMDPDYAKVHYSLSLAYSKMGMTREAEKEKKIFRKISQGEKVSKKSSSPVSPTYEGGEKSEHGGKTEREESAFGLTTKKSSAKEHSGFGMTEQLASTDSSHVEADKKTQVSEEKHAFSSKASRVGTGRDGRSAEKAQVGEEKHAFSSKAGHIEAEKLGHSTGQVRVDEHGSSQRGEQAASRGTEDDNTFKVKHDDVRAVQSVRPSSRGARKSLETSNTVFKGYTKEDASEGKSNLFAKKYGKSYGVNIRPTAYIRDRWAGSGINKIFICTVGYIFVTQMWLSVIALFGFIVWRIRKKNHLAG
ncbi:MAG: tetratricopeptide repeat protein [Candidatus Scalindua sp.]|nr:tetratricopeptide repeat protein [Candidatus Scalindua sp.]